MNSLAYIFSGLMFLIASAGAVDGTASPMWVAVLGFIWMKSSINYII